MLAAIEVVNCTLLPLNLCISVHLAPTMALYVIENPLSIHCDDERWTNNGGAMVVNAIITSKIIEQPLK